ISRALGLRARSDDRFILSQTGSKEPAHVVEPIVQALAAQVSDTSTAPGAWRTARATPLGATRVPRRHSSLQPPTPRNRVWYEPVPGQSGRGKRPSAYL